MERSDFVAALAPLLLALRVEFDGPTWSAYYRALSDVPGLLFERAVTLMLRDDRHFMPSPGELRAAAEKERRAVVAAFPYTGCHECEGQKGFRNLKVNGIDHVERCPCRGAYLRKLESLGVGGPPLLEAVNSSREDQDDHVTA